MADGMRLVGLPLNQGVVVCQRIIKKNNLQDAANKRNINADDKLKVIFGKPQVTMFEMTKLISAHLS